MTSIRVKKCPPFCRQDCRQLHHPILLALVNVQERDKKSLRRFIKLVAQYYDHDTRHLRPKTPIPDPIPEYRYPILLWAAVLGKITAIEHLITVEHDPRTQSSQKNETALHRVIHCFCPSMEKQHYSQAAIFKSFQKLVDLLAPALVIQDDNGDTPLHACATYITEYYLNARFNFYIKALVYMIDKVAALEDDDIIDIEGLDIKNRQGNTVFHLISSSTHEGCVDLAHKLLNNDANVRLPNDKGETVIDIAAELSSPIFNLISEKFNRLKRKVYNPPNTSNAKKQCARSSVVSSTSNDDDSAGVNSGRAPNHEEASANSCGLSSHKVASANSGHVSSHDVASANSSLASSSSISTPAGVHNVSNVKTPVTESAKIASDGGNVSKRDVLHENEHPKNSSVSNPRIHNTSNVKSSDIETVKIASDGGNVSKRDSLHKNEHAQISSVSYPRVCNISNVKSLLTETVKNTSDGGNVSTRDALNRHEHLQNNSLSNSRVHNTSNVKSSVIETVKIASDGGNLSKRDSLHRNEHPQISSVSNPRVRNVSNVKTPVTETIKSTSDGGNISTRDPSQKNGHPQSSSLSNSKVRHSNAKSSVTETVNIASNRCTVNRRDSLEANLVSTTENSQRARTDQNKAGPSGIFKSEDIPDAPTANPGEDDYALTLLEDLLKTADIRADVLKMIKGNKEDFALDLQKSKDFIRNLGEQQREGVIECDELDMKIQVKQRELEELKESVFSKRQMLADIKITQEIEESTCYDLHQKIERCDGIITRILKGMRDINHS